MDAIDKLKENLNEKQLEAVTETEGYVRVIAGAGSGKTKALTSRYAYIVEALGINSSNILCVTFTNKAAQEMRKRVKRLIGENADTSLISTYHGFCVRVLREDINKIQYPKGFIIMDVEDQKTILREVFRELGLTSKVFTFKQVLKYISNEKTSQEYLQYILEAKKKNSKNKIEQVFLRYLEKQQRNFALDFDDLLNYTLYIFSNHPDILEKWQKRIHYIQVDETQDSSQKQFMLIEMLSRYHKNLFVVGDPDQTIYEWRGAIPEILVDFDKQFPDSKTIIMDQNYRSTPNILNLGNHIIKNNKIRVDKDMFTNNEEGVDVVHFHALNDFEEGLWIANEIKRLKEKSNVKFSDVAILYRANYLSRKIEQIFIQEKIPYSLFGGIKFFERKEVKDVFAYLRLIEFGDDFSFLRIINTPRRGLGDKFIENISKLAEQQNISFLDALKINAEELSNKNPANRNGLIEFLDLINKFKKLKDELNISDLIKEILDNSGLSAYYRTDGDTERLDNIKELQNSIIQLEDGDGEKIILSEYLQEISLYTNMEVADDENDKVKLMTIHTSKGLEFPYVFLCGFTDGIIPSAMTLKEHRAKGLEEERRLAYVAITRAEKGFYMTESEGYNFISDNNKIPSRFLFEINEKYFVRKGELSQEVINEAKAQFKLELKQWPTQTLFEKGDFVNHKIWGDGKILEINKAIEEYQIEFFEINKIKPITFEFKGLKKIKKLGKNDNNKKKILKGLPIVLEINNESTEIIWDLEEEKKRKNSFLKDFIDDKKAEIQEKIEQLEKEKTESYDDTLDIIEINDKDISESIKSKIKEFARKEYPNETDMQEYIYENQIIGYKYMQSVKNNRFRNIATREFPNDYSMQQYTYENQISGYEYMLSINNDKIKRIAQRAYPNDYLMQQYTYDLQVEANDFMKNTINSSSKKEAIREYPNDYVMQKYIYDELQNNKAKEDENDKEESSSIINIIKNFFS